ncbi:hypothetical protein FVA96_23760 [Escherichia coli]|nr:hypothetical protein [Escherichia coli]
MFMPYYYVIHVSGFDDAGISDCETGALNVSLYAMHLEIRSSAQLLVSYTGEGKGHGRHIGDALAGPSFHRADQSDNNSAHL